MKLSFLSVLTTLIASLFMLTACGQKGPLYLPEKQQAPIVTPESSQANKTDSTKATQATKTEKTEVDQ